MKIAYLGGTFFLMELNNYIVLGLPLEPIFTINNKFINI